MKEKSYILTFLRSNLLLPYYIPSGKWQLEVGNGFWRALKSQAVRSFIIILQENCQNFEMGMLTV